MPMSSLLKNLYKSHLTELNVYHHYKPVETGTKYYYTPDIDDGYIQPVIYLHKVTGFIFIWYENRKYFF